VSPDFQLEGVRLEYRGGILALDAVDLTIVRGDHVAIVGANGSGKSTLLKILDGLVFPTSGSVTVCGAPLTEDVQLFCSNGRDELAFGPLQLGLQEEEVERRVREVAKQLGVEKLLDRAPYTLSGGEKKRLAIGSVLTMEPQVLLLDEPTSALDPRSQVWLLGVLDAWKREGRTAVIATHDLSAAAESADRMVVLSEDHTIVADGPPEEVLAQRELLLSVNLIHEHAHRHESVAHTHPHAH
jgi:cobalt/nickel transport system ATP-binding protein